MIMLVLLMHLLCYCKTSSGNNIVQKSAQFMFFVWIHFSRNTGQREHSSIPQNPTHIKRKYSERALLQGCVQIHEVFGTKVRDQSLSLPTKQVHKPQTINLEFPERSDLFRIIDLFPQNFQGIHCGVYVTCPIS